MVERKKDKKIIKTILIKPGIRGSEPDHIFRHSKNRIPNTRISGSGSTRYPIMDTPSDEYVEVRPSKLELLNIM